MIENVNLQLGMTNEEIESQLNMLYNSYEMYERTLKETTRTMKAEINPEDGKKKWKKSDIDSRLSLIKDAQGDIVEKINALGGSIEKYKAMKVNKSTSRRVSVPNQEIINKSTPVMQTPTPQTPTSVRQSPVVSPTMMIENVSSDESGFDLIPLPSKGQSYYNKMDKVLVSPLCANDENMIIAPNLYRDDLILDYLLAAKVKNCPIDPMDMLEGDREAILLWLRADGYGNDYPVKVKDEVTGEDFDAIVDLSTIKYKDFTLTSDAYGCFTFILPKCGSEIKFRYLTHRDMLAIKESVEAEDVNLKKSRLSNYVQMMDMYIDNEKSLSNADVVKIRKSIREIEGWCDKVEGEPVAYNHSLTEKLELSVVAVDSITDREYIHNFINNLNVKDASALRRYIRDNEPGVDYHFSVEKPESLGGGSQEVFLQFDKFLFLNIGKL